MLAEFGIDEAVILKEIKKGRICCLEELIDVVDASDEACDVCLLAQLGNVYQFGQILVTGEMNTLVQYSLESLTQMALL